MQRMGSVFDGTWRPDYGPPGPDAPPAVYSLADGEFECGTCQPQLRVPADGQSHPVGDNPHFDSIAVTVVNDRTVRQVGRRRGAVVYESETVIDAGGNTRSETRTASMEVDGELVSIPSAASGDASGPGPALFRFEFERLGLPEAGAHLLTGSWRMTAFDLLNHDEDTTYRIVDGQLSMTDRMGRSFRAPLDGTVVPYLGDARFTGVSVRQLDERTIEESNLSGQRVVQVARWTVDADGRTMHVRFDDGHGHVMEQSGHRLPEGAATSSDGGSAASERRDEIGPR
jgi:hypothetical protein